MASKFSVDFKQGLILEEDVNFGFEFNSRCHKYSVKKEHHRSPTSIKLVPTKVLKKPSLFGPATWLELKSIIYPCENFACAVPCPCLICSKTHPSCRVPSADGCSCPDCYKHFADHTDYHCTYHYGCKFCCQLVKTIPCFNFAFLDKEERQESILYFYGGPQGTSLQWSFVISGNMVVKMASLWAWESAGVNLVSLLFGVWMN